MAIAKTTVIPYHPIGVKVLLAWYENNNKEPPRGLEIGRRYVPSYYGEGQAFRTWLFDEYNGAEVVRHNKQPVIRFTDEHQLMMFMLKWS